MDKKKDQSFVSVKLFLGALLIIAGMMVCAYAATCLIPCDGIPFTRWLLSPLLVLTAEGSTSLIGVIIFLLIIGGVFNALEQSGILVYLLNRIAHRFGGRRYTLLGAVMFFFMALGSLIGSFEEVVPMVPLAVALALKLGWDRLTGVAMSLLAVGCGFAAGVFNPFTVGLAQELAGLPMFSGAVFRALNFVCIYALLFFFTRGHARRVDRGLSGAELEAFVPVRKMDKAVALFGGIIGFGILAVMSSAFLPFLRDYTFIIVGVMFLLAGITSCLSGGMSGSALRSAFFKGLVSMLPAVLMILMASSIKYTLEYAGLLSLLVERAILFAGTLPGWTLILFIYLIVLVMNFFIASGSAKAVMLMPLLLPLASSFGISPQLVIVAYAFGDGFSNVFYPTNPALLVALGLAETGYVDWAKWSCKFQLLNLLLTSLLLLLGKAIGV
ncbi:MAG: AbgT family transporter [Oscillospiraceae bacterium]|nr:AbgT family transporter [Oscillospiraceae bacterium]